MARWKIALKTLMLTLAFAAGNAGAEPADRNITVDGLRIHYLEWGPRTSRH